MRRILSKVKHSLPTVLTVVTAVGVVGVAYISHRNTLKHEKLKEEYRPVSPREKIECGVRAYWPTGALCIVTIGSAIFSRALSAKEFATLAAGAGYLSKKFREYRDTVKEELGAERECDIYTKGLPRNLSIHDVKIEAAKEDWTIFPRLPSRDDDNEEKVIFCEAMSNPNNPRFFEISIERVQQAIYHLNRNFAMRGFATLNEFFHYLGIDKVEDGDLRGWEWGVMMDEYGMAPWIDFYKQDAKFEDGKSYIILIPDLEPSYEGMSDWLCCS